MVTAGLSWGTVCAAGYRLLVWQRLLATGNLATARVAYITVYLLYSILLHHSGLCSGCWLRLVLAGRLAAGRLQCTTVRPYGYMLFTPLRVSSTCLRVYRLPMNNLTYLGPEGP